uniref:Uncharacterized protein n=1 Tax=Pinguiococcus pyrenoidosus TaxID=172671 RepID=A0A7R9U6U2_9STRA|mmetsp:Transcript_15051/g.57120  ORF Transcript_15051/g.57120 Transcript_15051/m.57120 type:complete len:778 (+) Transcript_15051:82-2415(+)
MATVTGTVTTAPLAPQLGVTLNNDELFPDRSLSVSLRLTAPPGADADQLLSAPFTCELRLPTLEEVIKCDTEDADALVSTAGAGILQLLEGRARFTLTLQTSFLQRVRGEASAVLVVRLYAASPLLGAPEPKSEPLLTGESSLLKICDKCLTINCSENKIPGKWYKDEGGQSNCLQIEITLQDLGGRQIRDADKQVNVSLKLLYEDGTEVSSQSILAVAKDTYALTEQGYVKILARIMEVSQRHQGKRFIIKAFTSNPGVAAGFTNPVCVLSKRKRHQRKKEENEKRVKDLRRTLQQSPGVPPPAQPAYNAAGVPLGAVAASNGQSITGRALTTPSPAPAVSEFVKRDGVRDAMSVMCSWVAQAMETLRETEWVLVSYEQDVRTGQIDRNFPVKRCPSCHALYTIVTPKEHKAGCKLAKVLRQYDAELRPYFSTIVDSLDLDEGTRLALKSVTGRSPSQGQAGNAYGMRDGMSGAPSAAVLTSMGVAAGVNPLSVPNMPNLPQLQALQNMQNIQNSVAAAHEAAPQRSHGGVSPRTLNAAAGLLSKRNSASAGGPQAFPPALSLTPSISQDGAPPFQLNHNGAASTNASTTNPVNHGLGGSDTMQKAPLDRQDSLLWLQQSFGLSNGDFGVKDQAEAKSPGTGPLPLGASGGLAPPTLCRGLTDAVMSLNMPSDASAANANVAYILRHEVDNMGLPAFDQQRKCIGFYKDGDSGNGLEIQFREGDPESRSKAERMFDPRNPLLEERKPSLRPFAEEVFHKHWSETGGCAAVRQSFSS